MSRRVAVALLVPAVLGVGGGVALGLLLGQDDPQPVAAGEATSVHRALCTAGDLAGDGEATQAARVFRDDAHSGLHALAAQVADVDRAAAARLLEAKQATEQALAVLVPAELERSLDRLASVTASAVVAAGLARPAACR